MRSLTIVLSVLAAMVVPIATNPIASGETGVVLASEWIKTIVWDNETDHNVERREPGGVYICTNPNWGGQCGWAKQPWDQCIQLDAPWNDAISSIGPDEYNALVAYQYQNCNPAGMVSSWYSPGYARLADIGWDNKISSFRVRQVSGPTCSWTEQDYLSGRLPGIDCRWCCEGCNRSGNGCCPA
ncbi:hypothetical protein B0I35DRAFT_461521, partial [Stachybotrys elegans]